MAQLLSARRPLLPAIVLAVSLGIVSLTPSSAQASLPTSSERTMASYVNHGRAAYGVRPMGLSSSLSTIARTHSAEMARAHRLYHTSNLAYRLRYYRWSVAGENVGYGSSLWAIYAAFMRSPSHRDNNLCS